MQQQQHMAGEEKGSTKASVGHKTLTGLCRAPAQPQSNTGVLCQSTLASSLSQAHSFLIYFFIDSKKASFASSFTA